MFPKVARLMRRVVRFFWSRKRWWLPTAIVLAILGVLLFLARETTAGPSAYSLF